ncbi:MAG: hypothetical protein QOH04_1703 [Sphingomonadales bacterium]|nr:hypothetical protein [Sphingomonadales bacterium]
MGGVARRRWGRRMLAAAALAGVSSPLAAQSLFAPFAGTKDVTVLDDELCPPRVSDDIVICGRRNPTPAEMRILREYSACLAQRRPQAARDSLAEGYQGAETRRALLKVAQWGRRCGQPGRLKVSGILFAGAMAEALLRPLARAKALEARLALDPARPPLRARDDSEVMSLCVAIDAPGQVAKLLATEGASPEEKAALGALVPAFAGCLRSQVKLVANPPALRAMLALAAWRLARHNEPPKIEETKMRRNVAAAAALVGMATATAPAAAQTDCNTYRDDYQLAIDDVSATLRLYARCLELSGGEDDCGLQFKALEKAQKKFDRAVLQIRFNCRSDRRARNADPE